MIWLQLVGLDNVSRSRGGLGNIRSNIIPQNGLFYSTSQHNTALISQVIISFKVQKMIWV